MGKISIWMDGRKTGETAPANRTPSKNSPIKRTLAEKKQTKKKLQNQKQKTQKTTARCLIIPGPLNFPGIWAV